MVKDIQELNFPNYATLSQADINIADMGEMSISAQLEIDGNIAPDFSYDWEIMFQGEKYIMPIHKPQGEKNNKSLNSVIDLTFRHWAIYAMEGKFFVEMTSEESDTAVADKYVVPLSLNFVNFVAALNRVLDYYFNGDIVADIYEGLHPSPDPVVLNISYTTIWDVLVSVFDNYAVRWQLKTENGICRIKFGFPTKEVSHVFEYGFEGGLMSVQRQVPSEDVKNILLGRGGEDNIPYRYFKNTDPQNPSFKADPDWVPELANVHFSELRDSVFRSYVQGWKARHYDGNVTEEEAYNPWAYRKGYTDERFKPVEYVKDDKSIEMYGERWGASNHDDIKPTIQNVVIDPLGRIDEVVAVEEIPEEEDGEEEIKYTREPLYEFHMYTPMAIAPHKQRSIRHFEQTITIPYGQKANVILGSTTYDAVYSGPLGPDSNAKDVTLVTLKHFLVTKDKEEIPPAGVTEGTYEVWVEFIIENTSDKDIYADVTVIDNYLELSPVSGYTEYGTFNIWVKNLWSTEKGATETEREYSERVWKDILGDGKDEAYIVFSDGLLGLSEDYNFKIVGYPAYDTSKTFNNVPSHWRIKLARSEAELDATGKLLPNSETNAVAGNHFFFTGIDLPYLYYTYAEKMLTLAKTDVLAKYSDIVPTWVVSTDRIRMNTLQGEETETLINAISIGSAIQLSDKRFITYKSDTGELLPDVPELLYIKSIEYKYRTPKESDAALNPDVTFVLSNDYSVSANPVDLLQGEVDALSRQVGYLSNIDKVVQAVGRKIFLQKDKRDRTPFPLNAGDKFTAEKGIQIGESFVHGFTTGRGGLIDKDANAELETLVLRRFLEAPELRFNRTRIESGDRWNAPGMGILEKVEPDKDEEGTTLLSGTAYLKLEDGELGEIAVGDICMGIFHSMASDENFTESTDDSYGNFMYAGFYTCYFTIVSILSANNGIFRYSLRPASDKWPYTYHPSSAMHFVSYGSFTDPDRQTSQYSTRTYTRLLWRQNTWEISLANIAMQWGDLSNMSIHGKDMTGYSAYLNSVYFTGTIERVKPDGTPVQTANDRGAWVSGEHYDYYDRVSYDGSLWLCINEQGTSDIPSKTNSNWLLQVSQGKQGINGDKGEQGERGEQGIQGCIMRHSEWALGVEYHNDENLTSGIRYIDIAMIRNEGAFDGWDVYKCNVTHTSTNDKRPDKSTIEWTKLSGVGPIFTSLIIAKNAVLEFVQGNEIIIKKSDGTVTAGLSGSEEGSKVRIWVGSATPDNAPFRVLEDGTFYSDNAYVSGRIEAYEGTIGGFAISGNNIETDNQGHISFGDENFSNTIGAHSEKKDVVLNTGLESVLILPQKMSYLHNNKTSVVNATPNAYNWENISIANFMDIDYFANKYGTGGVSPNRYGYQYAMIGNGHVCMNGIVDGMCLDNLVFTTNNQIEWIAPPMWSNRICVVSNYTGCFIALPDWPSLSSCFGSGIVRPALRKEQDKYVCDEFMSYRVTFINVGSNSVNIVGKSSMELSNGKKPFDNDYMPVLYDQGLAVSMQSYAAQVRRVETYVPGNILLQPNQAMDIMIIYNPSLTTKYRAYVTAPTYTVTRA